MLLTFLFFCGLALLSLHPEKSLLPEHPPLILRGPAVVAPGTVRSWLGGDPHRDVYRSDKAGDWLIRHPWVARISFKRFLWGGGAILVRMKSPVAVLRASSSETPGNPASPWKKTSSLPYLLPDGKVMDGRIYPGTDRLPQVIIRSPIDAGMGQSLVSAIALVDSCRGHGAPAGHLYVFRGRHEIRFFPDRTTAYLVLPEDGHCEAFRLYEKALNYPGRLPKGVVPQGYDLRFRGMLLIRPEPTDDLESGQTGRSSVPH